MAYILGLEDLIAGVTPTLSGWTVDPTDAADITDGDISTLCATGNKVDAAAWDEAVFEWDLGAFYDVLIGGVGGGTVAAGTLYAYGYGYDGSAWVYINDYIGKGVSVKGYYPGLLRCSKVRLALCSSAIATITPNIREFHVWRL